MNELLKVGSLIIKPFISIMDDLREIKVIHMVVT